MPAHPEQEQRRAIDDGTAALLCRSSSSRRPPVSPLPPPLPPPPKSNLATAGTPAAPPSTSTSAPNSLSSSSLPHPSSASWRTRPFTGEFRDPRVERAFWSGLVDSGRLSQLDAVASAVLSFCLLTAVAAFGRQGMDRRPCAVAAALMLLLTAAARGRWRLYEKRRTLVASLARVVIVFATCSSAFSSLPLFAHAWGAAFLQSGGSRSSGAAHAAAVAVASGRASASGFSPSSSSSQQGVESGSGIIGIGSTGVGGSPNSPSSAFPSSSSSSGHTFGAGVPGHWLAAAANSPPWARRWSAFFTRTPRVQALLLPALLVAPPRAHASVSLLCALAAVAVLGSTVAGREAYFGREKHVEVARFLSSLTRWLVRLPASSAAAALAGVSRPAATPRGIAEERATAAVMIAMQVCLGLLLPTHVMFAWQAQARRAFRDAELARRKREEEDEREGEEGGEEEEEGAEVERVALRRRCSGSPLTSSSASAALLTRSARVDSALLALGLQLSAVVCFWFVLEELDALAGERKLWFSLP